MADLTTFIPVRRRPTGPVETFSTERAAETVPVDDRHRGRRHDPAALRGRRARQRGHLAAQPGPQEQPRLRDRRLHLRRRRGIRSGPSELWIGHRDRPNELLLRNPALMNALGSAAARLPGGHVEGFADTFGALFRAIYADVLAGRPVGIAALRGLRRRPRRDARRGRGAESARHRQLGRGRPRRQPARGPRRRSPMSPVLPPGGSTR